MKLKHIAAAVAALLIATHAGAAERNADDGLYLRGGFGTTSIPTTDAITGEDADSWTIGTGLRFADHFSVDVNVDRLGEIDEASIGIGGPQDLRLTSLSVAGGATFDLGDSGFFAQARVGLHRWDARRHSFATKSTVDGIDPYGSLAIGYDITELFGVILSVERFYFSDGPLGDSDRIMLGFELR